LSPTLAEEGGGRGVTIGEGLDVHGSHYTCRIANLQNTISFKWDHFVVCGSS
jgi:hypothetical protein